MPLTLELALGCARAWARDEAFHRHCLSDRRFMLDSARRSLGHRWSLGPVVGAWGAIVSFAATQAGCDRQQSTLAPAGREAQQIADLFWWMFGAGALIWLFMMGLGAYVLVSRRRPHSERQTRLFVIVGGAVLPTILLVILLCCGLAMLPRLVARAPTDSLTIDVHGVQWWWRVRYALADGESIELANEICLPVNEPVGFNLRSEDVIHSFWIPSIGGKVDMIPGRTTRLVLHPNRTGIFRGACAEYCGTSHALMNFYVRVVSRDEFDAWLARQKRDAVSPTEPSARRGAQLFVSSGCGACHTLRGTSARGRVGPDLTHFGSRHSVGAGILPNDRQSISHWLQRTGHIKPEVEMPDFHVLGEEQLADLAAYLEQLK